MTAPDSLFDRLEPLLATVSKPIQYVGGELNSTVKDWESVDVRWCLMYPDAYEVGLPNQGIAILYELLNEQDWILAERSYAVWADLESLMRQRGIPQFTLDSHRPVGAFDVVALFDDQELDSRASTGSVYWEGLSELRDATGRTVGRGYLEMTGYTQPLRL